MKNFKTFLLGAVAVSSLCSTGAQAQAIIDPALVGTELKGAGASSIENVVVTAFNCVSGPTNAQQLGKGGNVTASTPVPASLTPIASGVFTPTTPNAANPVFNCATNSIQPNFKAKYVSTGSGFGREIWRNFSNRFNSGVPTNSNANPFEVINGDPAWTNVQFAFTDGPISATDLSTYNTNANSATNLAGKGIQIPLYVLPVALAYSAQYGVNGAGTPLNFVVPTGGIKLNQAQYCGIFNGVITNFKTISATLKDPIDTTARWNADGVPIRLVGRLDNSGTTDIFTRHLKEVCGTTGNKFINGANQQLPGGSGNTPGAAGTAISSAVYTGGLLSSGAEAVGLFGRATGSSGVAAAIAAAPDLASPSEPTTLLNGKFGYISSDFVTPATGATLQAAQLTQVGSTTAYKKPNATDAGAAFATILPPQSTAASGAYNPTGDLRKNSVTGVLVNRANPLDWADVLYSRADTSGGFTARTLAAPPAGYPITGTTFLLTSTCFKKDSDRLAMSEFLYAQVKKISKDSTATGKVSTSLFSGVSASLKGLTAQANLAPLSAGWQKAIFETFLQKTTGALGLRGLFIQSKQPTTTLTGITSNTGGTDSNVGGVAAAACTVGAGA